METSPSPAPAGEQLQPRAVHRGPEAEAAVGGYARAQAREQEAGLLVPEQHLGPQDGDGDGAAAPPADRVGMAQQPSSQASHLPCTAAAAPAHRTTTSPSRTPHTQRAAGASVASEASDSPSATSASPSAGAHHRASFPSATTAHQAYSPRGATGPHRSSHPSGPAAAHLADPPLGRLRMESGSLSGDGMEWGGVYGRPSAGQREDLVSQLSSPRSTQVGSNGWWACCISSSTEGGPGVAAELALVHTGGALNGWRACCISKEH